MSRCSFAMGNNISRRSSRVNTRAHYTPCFRRLHRQCFGDCIACANKSRINRYVKTITKCVVLLIVDAINKFDGETYCKMLCLYQRVFLVIKKNELFMFEGF